MVMERPIGAVERRTLRGRHGDGGGRLPFRIYIWQRVGIGGDVHIVCVHLNKDKCQISMAAGGPSSGPRVTGGHPHAALPGQRRRYAVWGYN